MEEVSVGDISHARKRNSSELGEPIAIQRNIPEVFQIFHNVQFNTVQHKKYVKELKKIFHKIDEDIFRESFTNALHYTFMFGEANGNVDRVLQFVASFCTSVEDDEDFLHYVFGVIFDCVSVTGQGVRSRSCQFLGLLLTALGEEASLDDDICDKILSTQLDRLQDVRGAVRCRAVLTLQRLQNPMDDADPVTRAYAFHMSCDPSAAVRRAVVLSLAKSSHNLLHVLERLCDIDESVRKAAFLYVSSINVTQLKVRQRVHILKVGLTERSQRVRRVVETALLPGWLGIYRGNILDLLAAIRLDNFQGAKDSAFVAANMLQALFKLRPIAELLEWLPIDTKLKLIPAEHLTKESAWYWRHLVRHLHSIEDTDHLEEALPELIIFTGYVQAFVESPWPAVTEHHEYSRHQHILHELMNIFYVYDMADEVGRAALQALLYDILMGTYGTLDPDVINAIMRATDLVIPKVENRIEFVAGIVSEIHEPSEENIIAPVETPLESNETKLLRARFRVSLNEALEEQDEAVRAQNFALAAECKEKVVVIQKKLDELNINLKEIPVEPIVEKIKEKRDDPETLNKCLTIIIMLLDSPQITTLTPRLTSLFQDFEMNIFQKPEIRENALKIVALYSMLDEEFAKEHKAFFFTQFMDMDNEALLIVALKCVIDIMCVHGVKTFNIGQKDGESENNETKMQNKRKSKTFKSRKNKTHPLSSTANTIPASDDDSDDDEIEQTLPLTPTHDTIIELFLRFMNSESVEYRAVVVEGFCRLLMASRLSSSRLISRLLLLWFNPATEEEDTLKQTLGTFFPLFASHVEDAQEQLEAAFIPTLTTLANAPLGSPLAEVDSEVVIKFMIGLTLSTVSPTASNVHSNLCVLICSTLDRGADLAEPNLCRALALLAPPRTKDLCEDLLCSTKSILEGITDKVSYRNLTRFQATLAIAIENMEQRPSINTRLDSLPEITEPSISMDTFTSRESVNIIVPKQTELNSSPKESETDFDALSEISPSQSENSEARSEFSTSPISSPPKKIKAISAAEVAKRAIRSSTKGRTPRSTRKISTPANIRQASTPQPTPNSALRRSNRASVKKVVPEPKPTPIPKKTASRSLNKQMEDASKDDKPKNVKKKAVNNKKTTKASNKKVQEKKKVSDSDKSSSSEVDIQEDPSSDEGETLLYTICHEPSAHASVFQNSSDEEDLIVKKTRPNITIPASDSSDEFSSDDDDAPVPLSQRRILTKKR